MDISWTCALEYVADLCTNQGLKFRERQVSLTEERRKEKMQFMTSSGSVSRQRFPVKRDDLMSISYKENIILCIPGLDTAT